MRLLCFLAALVAVPASAQISFSSDDVVALLYGSAGTSTAYATNNVGPDDAARIEALLGQTGPGQTWDLTGIDYSERTETTTRVLDDLAGLPGADGFPDATVAVETRLADDGPEEASYTYFSAGDDAFVGLGGFVGGEDPVTLRFEPDGLVLATFPFTVGTAFESEAEVTTEPAFGEAGALRLRVEVVGSGTLVLPTGSYPALMARQTAVQTVEIPGFDPFDTTDTTTEWVTLDGVRATASDGVLEPGDPPSYSSTYTVPGRATALGRGPEPLAVTAAPNPTAGTSTVLLTGLEGGPARVRVFDAIGREVAVLHDGPLGAGDHAFSTSGLAPGVYVVRVEAEGRAGTVRLVVTR